MAHKTTTPGHRTYRAADGTTRRALVYTPARANGDLVVDVHGGAWTWYTAEVDRWWCTQLAARGATVVSVDFCSALERPWPAGYDDVRCATAWAREEFADADSRVTVMGGSTGGHLAALVGLHGDHDGVRPDRVVALWPIVDVVGRWEMVRPHRLAASPPAEHSTVPTRARAGEDGYAGPGQRQIDRLVADRLSTSAVRRGRALVAAELLHVANAAQASIGPAKRKLYSQLARAHELTFPGGVEQMRSASPTEELQRRLAAAARHGEPGRGGDIVDRADLPELPDLLVVHADADANTTEEMSSRFVGLWAQCGGRSELLRVPRAGHSFANIPSHASARLIERIARFLNLPSN